jgi:hypothetical protein
MAADIAWPGKMKATAHPAVLLVLLLLLVGCSAGAHEAPQQEAAHDTTVTADTIPPATATTDTLHTAAPAQLSEYHLRRFRERGLDDPLRDIPADLEDIAPS